MIFLAKKWSYKSIETILKAADTYTENNRKVRSRAGLKDILRFASWKLGLVSWEYFNPTKAFKGKIGELLKETVVAVKEAEDNALRHGSEKAVEHVGTLIENITCIFKELEKDEIESVSEIENSLNEIILQARAIAGEEGFEDEGSYREERTSEERTDEKNYYEILMVTRSASDEEIKRAYLFLSKKYHPDLYKHLAEDFYDEAEERFKKINKAHETLSDPKKREQYDQTLS
ncbi:DnaJ domain-containing protein [Candidatus Woesearchaeota archaeon]|nr:DnaJ domain-containing protein [Candidatus Woesearchaeota archaeon]